MGYYYNNYKNYNTTPIFYRGVNLFNIYLSRSIIKLKNEKS